VAKQTRLDTGLRSAKTASWKLPFSLRKSFEGMFGKQDMIARVRAKAGMSCELELEYSRLGRCYGASLGPIVGFEVRFS
jgi:hypothetical protein